jgi:hypothetical protein
MCHFLFSSNSFFNRYGVRVVALDVPNTSGQVLRYRAEPPAPAYALRSDKEDKPSRLIRPSGYGVPSIFRKEPGGRSHQHGDRRAGRIASRSAQTRVTGCVYAPEPSSSIDLQAHGDHEPFAISSTRSNEYCCL